MTAREFLEYAGAEVSEGNLYALTRYLDSEIDFSQFPDTRVGDLAEQADEPVGFQEYLDRQNQTCANCR
jgi:hypothetical protein